MISPVADSRESPVATSTAPDCDADDWVVRERSPVLPKLACPLATNTSPLSPLSEAPDRTRTRPPDSDAPSPPAMLTPP
eukprot:7301784-Prorocentrum_lima.AAC.1